MCPTPFPVGGVFTARCPFVRSGQQPDKRHHTVSGFEKALVQTDDAFHKQFKEIVSPVHGFDCQAHGVSDSRIAGSKQAMSVLPPKTLCQMSTVFQCSDSSKQMMNTKSETYEVECAWRRMERKITGRRLKRISWRWRWTCRIEWKCLTENWGYGVRCGGTWVYGRMKEVHEGKLRE